MDAGNVRMIGHRGGAADRHPENSIPAFLEGLRKGADVLETDVHLSRDGHVFVIHDHRIDRVTNGSGEVAALGAAEIRRFSMVDPRGRIRKDLSVPVLEEFLQIGGDVPVNIDLKSQNPELARRVAAIIEAEGARDRVTVASFFPEALRFFRSIAPGVETACTSEEIRDLLRGWFSRETPRVQGQRVQVPVRHGVLPLARRGFVRYLHRHGIRIDVWTINEAAQARRLIQRGVDGIITDDIGAMRAAFGSSE